MTINDTRSVTILDVALSLEFPRIARTFRKYHAASTQGKPFAVDGVHATWKRSDGEAWRLYTLRIFGAVIKKDGSRGQVAGQRDYLDYGSDHLEPEPWLLDEIERYAPEPW